MKTSTTYLLAALLVLLASLTAYNMALRTEYRSGAYKDPLRNYEVLAFKNFTEVDIPAASALSVKIVAGPFGVRVNPAAARFVHVSQQGGRLVIAAAFPSKPESLGWSETVVVSCPRLAKLSAGGTYELAGQPHRDKILVSGRRVLVQGFTQDSLTLRQDLAGHVELAGNRLGYLGARVGLTPGSYAGLQLNDDNHLAAASLVIDHQSELTVANLLIPQVRYQFSDSARVTLMGRALRSVR
jgi:hypothetical protein